MNQESIVYKQDTATAEQVVTHLLNGDDEFIKTLGKKVDITAYSMKIVLNSVTFEAWENVALVGLIAAYFNDPEKKSGFITNVSTVKGKTGKGIASRLLKQCIEYATENNFVEIKLEVSAENEHTIKLYRKFGFIQLEDKPGSIIMTKICK